MRQALEICAVFVPVIARSARPVVARITQQAAVGGVEGPTMKLGHWLPPLMAPKALLCCSAAAVHRTAAETMAPTPLSHANGGPRTEVFLPVSLYHSPA